MNPAQAIDVLLNMFQTPLRNIGKRVRSVRKRWSTNRQRKQKVVRRRSIFRVLSDERGMEAKPFLREARSRKILGLQHGNVSQTHC